MTERTVKQKVIVAYAQATWSDFPKDEDGVLYVRQSSLAQMRKNIHSFEMQTDKFVEHFRRLGCTGKIYIIIDDIKGKTSGALDIADRPGLSTVISWIRNGKVRWVGAVHVNRLTRDKWLITPTVLMRDCADHNVWIATLDRLYDFKYEESQEHFMDKAKEAAGQLKWMKQVMGGAKLVASEQGLYDGRNLSVGYIVDRTDLKHMKYIVYRRHARIVLWLFKRFLALNGNFPALRREVEARPYLFRPFESWVDPKNTTRFVMKEIPDGPFKGYFKPTADGLKSILTNPVYIGLWIPFEGDEIENNHEAIVSEDLFWYAYNRLATTNLNGERIRPVRANRKHNSEALLVEVICDEDERPIYKDNSNGKLYYQKLEHTHMGHTHGFSINHAIVDTMFLEKLLERVNTLSLTADFTDWEDTIEQAREEKEERNSIVIKSIKEARRLWEHNMSMLKNPDIPKTEQMTIDLAQTCAGLEAKIRVWEESLTEEAQQSEQEVLYQIHALIPRIATEWENFTYPTKLMVISGLVRWAILSQVSSGWLRLTIIWKLPEWGTDSGYIRKSSSKASWSETEESVIRQLYPTGSVTEMLEALPMRNWNGIQEKASFMEVRRVLERRDAMASVRESGIPTNVSLDDWRYALEHNLSFLKNTRWTG